MPKDFLLNYFGFNKQQRRGLLVLISISLFLLLVRIVYPFFITPDEITIKNLPLYERRLDSSLKSRISSEEKIDATREGTLFMFDPNSVSFKQLLKLGFKEKRAKTFLKYRSKGFVFKRKEDVKKVYGISDALYLRLEPYILLEKKGEKDILSVKSKNTKKTSATKQQKLDIELNSVDSIGLLGLDGIGPSYAKRILKYRSILGGYVNTEQLKEVYGFPEELYEKIKPFVRVDVKLIKKININKDNFKSINKHPYLSYELTKSIFDWRRKTTITAINFKDIINDEALYQKLLPYLIFD